MGVAALWLALWLLPWQGMLEDLPWLRVALAFAMFVVPGGCLQQWIDRSTPSSTSRFLSVGFCVSVALTGFLGILARVGHLPIDLVNTGLMVIGLVGILGLPRSPDMSAIDLRKAAIGVGLAIPLVVAIALVFDLTSVYGRTTDIDFATHHAQVTDFQGSSGLDYTHFVFGSDAPLSKRFWLSYWSLGQAVVASQAGMHVIELYPFLMPAVALVAILALVELATGLGLSRPWARLAAIAQVAMLATLWEEIEGYRVGRTFLQYTLIDNNVATHVIAPVLMLVISSYLTSGGARRLVLVALVAFGSLFTHPGMLGLFGLIIGAYAVIRALFEGWSRREPALLSLLAVVVAIPFSFRFLWQEQVLPSSLDQLDFIPRAVTVQGESGLYSVSLEYAMQLPFLWVLLAGVVGLFHVHKNPAARYVVACLLVLGVTMTPHGGWLVGSAVTPTILGRVLWFAPFGLAVSFALQKLFEPIGERCGVDSRLAGSALSFVAAAWTAFSIGARHPIDIQDEINYPVKEYVELADALDDLLPEEAIVVGDKELNTHLPTLSANAKTITHRTEYQRFEVHFLSRFGAFGEEEAARRIESWEAICKPGPNPRRVQLLRQFGASYYVAGGRTGRRQRPDRLPIVGLTLEESVGRFKIYRVD